MPIMSLKKLRWLAMLLIVQMLMLSACQQAPIQSPKPRTSLTLLHYFSGEFSGGIDALVGGFNQEQDQYLLNAVPIEHEAFKVSILKALEDENPPELYSYWAGARTEAIVSNLEPLDAIWEEAELDAIFPKSLISDACMIDGKHYLLPITQHYVAFFYNKAVFERVGIQPPANWEEFLAACDQLKANGITPIGLGSKNQWPAQFWFDYLLLRTQPMAVREALMSGELPYTAPEVVSTFELWKSLIDKGYFNADPNNQDWHELPLKGISEGTVGMTLMGTWAISTLEKSYNQVAGRDFGYFDFPTINEAVPTVALGPVDGLIVPSASQNTDGAMSAIAYLARKESQKSMALGSGAISPSLQVPDETYGVLQREMLPVMRGADNWAFNYDLATAPERATLGLELFSDFLVFPESYKELLKEIQKKLEAQ